MIKAAIPANEAQRLHALKQYGVLDTDPEPAYNELIELASEICNVPISMISLIDSDRQFYKAKIGLPGKSSARDTAFCAHAILDDKLMEVEDAKNDIRFFDNPLVSEDPNIRFYAGMPLVNPDGYKLGTLCVIDNKPRKLNKLQRQALETLSRQVVKQFELRLKNDELSRLSDIQNKMLSVISHDVRGPLNSLQILLEFIDPTETDTQELKEVLIDALKLVSNGRELLENMLAWANSMQKEGGFYPEEVKLKVLTQTLLQDHEVKARKKGIQLINQMPDHLEGNIDKQMTTFVLRYLLTNALKFTASGSITLGGEAIDGGVELYVQDTGCGISANDLPKLLHWGNRFTTQGTAKEGGAGVGLLLAREFIHRHGGKLNIESVLNEGTTMRLVLMNQEA